jgi:dihydroflavonol-4-reductase
MRCFVTGGTGFVGGAVVRKLLAEGHRVRALVRHGTNTRQLDGLQVERIAGDLNDGAALREGMAGCGWVFHVAALYAYWGYSWQQFLETNVEGTRRVLNAASQSGPQRVVYTSSIATLGIPKDGMPGDEETPVTFADTIGFYKRSKFLAEEVAREFIREGLPVVIVNPAAPVGVGDHKPTQTGKMILDFLNGKMPAFVDTGLTIVDVDDVATGHLLAAKLGKIGERYILGGETLSLKQVLDILAEVSGQAKVQTRIPRGVALAWAYLDTALARLNPSHIPAATPDAVRVSAKREFFSSAKAIRELGFSPSPARDALLKAVEWYRENGYLAPQRSGGACSVSPSIIDPDSRS